MAWLIEAYLEEGLVNKFKKNKLVEDYRVTVPKEVKAEGEKALKILKTKIKALENSKEYKDIVKAILNADSDKEEFIPERIKDVKLDSTVSKSSVKYTEGSYYYVGLTSYDMDQAFYFWNDPVYKNGSIYNLIIKLYNDLKSDKSIIELPHFHNVYIGDDTYDIGINFKF